MAKKTAAASMRDKYIIGFVLSLIITITAYLLTVGSVYTGMTLYLIIGGLALVQMIVQLYYFLHMGEELKPRLRLLLFAYTSLMLLIVVVGSLWIMHHLNYNMMEMSPQEKTEYMTGQKDKGF